MTKEAIIFFGNDEHYDLKVAGDAITLDVDKDGTHTSYDVTGGGGGGIESKTLYTNPDISQRMSGDTILFAESEIEGYEFLVFTITTTSGDFEVREWCEIAPLKSHSGQFIVSIPIGSTLYGRKVYRTSGNVKPSVGVYELGKTTENRDACIIKTVECVKGVL